MNTNTQSQNISQNINSIVDEKNMFFTPKEREYMLKNFENIVLYMDNGMPYINYDVAKRVFENIVGNNYSIQILSKEFIPEFDVYMVHISISLTRGDKTIVQESIGCKTAMRSKHTNEITKFENLPKSAIKDGFKKFLSDYIGIGSVQYAKAKKEYEENQANKNNNYNSINIKANNHQMFACSDCNAQIDGKITDFSTKKYNKPLCLNCQKKY